MAGIIQGFNNISPIECWGTWGKAHYSTTFSIGKKAVKVIFVLENGNSTDTKIKIVVKDLLSACQGKPIEKNQVTHRIRSILKDYSDEMYTLERTSGKQKAAAINLDECFNFLDMVEADYNNLSTPQHFKHHGELRAFINTMQPLLLDHFNSKGMKKSSAYQFNDALVNQEAPAAAPHLNGEAGAGVASDDADADMPQVSEEANKIVVRGL